MTFNASQPIGVRVQPLSRAKIRGDAHQIRDIFAREMRFNSSFVPIVEAVEFLDAYGWLEFSVVEDWKLNGVAAQLQPRTNNIPLLEVCESVYEKGCNHDSFARFTFAHELGHFFLHSNQNIPLHRLQPNSVNHSFYEDTEWQANTFAAELLVDSRRVITLSWDTKRIATEFGVSEQAAGIRYKVLKTDGLI